MATLAMEAPSAARCQSMQRSRLPMNAAGCASCGGSAGMRMYTTRPQSCTQRRDDSYKG